MQVVRLLLQAPDRYFGEPGSSAKRPRSYARSVEPRRKRVPTISKPAPPSPQPLQAIYASCARGDTEGALDQILDLIDGYIAARDLAGCDALLGSVEVERLDVPSTLGFLSATHAIAKQLPGRAALYQAAHARIARERPHDLEKLLHRFQ